jgi:hypothetical protein
LESSYADLVERQHRGEHGTQNLELELDRLQRFLSAARRDLNRTEGGTGHRNPGDDTPSAFRTHSWRGV